MTIEKFENVRNCVFVQDCKTKNWQNHFYLSKTENMRRQIRISFQKEKNFKLPPLVSYTIAANPLAVEAVVVEVVVVFGCAVL